METGLQLLTKSEQEGDGEEKEKKKSLGVFWCFKLVIVEEMIPKGGFVFCLVFKRFKLVTVEINPQGRFFLCENLGVFVFCVSSSKKKKT